MKNSLESQEFEGYEASRVTFPAELKAHLLNEESIECIDLRASVPYFIKFLNQEIQCDCPGAVADLDVQWDVTDENASGNISVKMPDNVDEDMEKCDAVASAMWEAFENVRLEYDWEVFRD